MKAEKLNPGEPIKGLEGVTVGDYWSWAYSDIYCSANRSALAVFVVGKVLGVVDTPRIEWDGYDLRYGTKKIEVKCSAYIMSPDPEDKVGLSVIRFDIGKKLYWSEKIGANECHPGRPADLYVFCLYPVTDRKNANILDIEAWEFYVVSKDKIDKHFEDEKIVGLDGLRSICDPVKIDELRRKVDGVLSLC